jgi:hypothetical protein
LNGGGAMAIGLITIIVITIPFYCVGIFLWGLRRSMPTGHDGDDRPAFRHPRPTPPTAELAPASHPSHYGVPTQAPTRPPPTASPTRILSPT